MINRIIGVLKLDKGTFREIENDPKATTEAAIIVAIGAVLTAVGAYFAPQNAAIEAIISPGGAFVSAIVNAFLTWIIWSYSTYLVGTKVFGADTNFQEMLRLLGYARVPAFLGILAIIPLLGCFVGIAQIVLSILCAFFALREGLDLDDGKTILTAILSFIPAIILTYLVSMVFGMVL